MILSAAPPRASEQCCSPSYAAAFTKSLGSAGSSREQRHTQAHNKLALAVAAWYNTFRHGRGDATERRYNLRAAEQQGDQCERESREHRAPHGLASIGHSVASVGSGRGGSLAARLARLPLTLPRGLLRNLTYPPPRFRPSATRRAQLRSRRLPLNRTPSQLCADSRRRAPVGACSLESRHTATIRRDVTAALRLRPPRDCRRRFRY